MSESATLMSPNVAASPTAPMADDHEFSDGKPKPSEGAGRRRFWLAAATVAALGVALFAWDGLKYRFIPKRFGVVVAGQVYRSGQISKWQFEPTVAAHGIRTVIDLNGIDTADEHQAAEIASAARLGLEHLRFPLRGDGTGNVETYIDAIAALARCHREGKPVLVHCHAGAQRTGSVVAAYRALVLGDPPSEVYAELSRYGWKAGTDQTMLLYLNGNLRHVAEALAKRGVIAAVPETIPVIAP